MIDKKELKTIEGIAAIPREFIFAEEAAAFTSQNAQSIRIQAKEDPAKLGYPVSVCNGVLMIPKWPFIAFWTGIGREVLS